MKGWLAAGNGLTDVAYEVLLNQDYLLSFQFQYSYGGLSEPKTHHLTFDLHTGRVLTLPDLVADTPAQLNRRLGAAISRRLRDNLADVVAEYGDSATIASVAALYDLETWDTTPQRGLALDTGGTVEDNGLIPLEFALRPSAVLLFLSCRDGPGQLRVFTRRDVHFPLQPLAPAGPASASGPAGEAQEIIISNVLLHLHNIFICTNVGNIDWPTLHPAYSTFGNKQKCFCHVAR